MDILDKVLSTSSFLMIIRVSYYVLFQFLSALVLLCEVQACHGQNVITMAL